MQVPSSENNHTNHEEGDMCRVCRSSESTGNNRLFHPCKCSGSMKFVHQQCLEDWLRHSGKESCDICKHVFKFQPIYDPTQPRRFSLGWSVWLILKQITKSVLGYCWAMFALFCWLVWVPFITSLTWRVFMAHEDYNPTMVATARQPKFSMLLVELFDITSIKVVQFMQWVEMSRNWPRLIRMFLTDVFEGQIICSLIVVFGMFLLLLREHLLMNMEEDDEPIAVERPANAQPPVHVVPLNDGLLAPLPDDDTFFEYDDPQDLFMQRENLAETLQMRLDMNGGQGMNQANFEHNIPRPEPMRPVGVQPRLRDGHEAVRNIQALLAEDPNELERFLLEAAERADPNPPNPAVLPAANNNEAVDDFDPRGFLDLVGVRGPAKHLLQNLLLVHAVIVLCLTLGIWLPNVIGKYASYFTVHLLWPTLQKWNDDGIIFLQLLTDPFVEPIVDYLAIYLNSTSTPASTPEISIILPLNHTNSFVTVLKAMLFGIEQTDLQETNTKSVTSHTFFEFLKKDLSNVLSGYVAIGILLVAYVNLATMVRNRYLSAFTRICNRTVNYMLKGLKLLTFFVAELGLFPLYCGMLVDYWVFPLISTISFEERVNIFQYHPWIFVILHWIIGTTFMYHFAMYIGFVRESIRPGVLWFIRDPNDPDINIVREVLSRPFFSQIRKLVFAIALYGIVISGVLGGAVGIVRASDALAVKKFGHQTLFKIMPLRYQYHDSIMREMPFDLFFFRFISPFILKYLKPSVAFSNFVRTWFGFVAHRLRMSHFLLGTKREDEELLPSHQDDLTYMRVPNHDRVEPIGWSRMHIRMKKEDPIFGKERDQTENVARNWTKVYVPDKLRLRVFSLLGLQWITFSIGLFLFITLPTLFGRMIFAGLQSLTTFTADIPKSYVNPVDVIRNDVPVHDFYSFTLGLLLIASLLSIVKVISMMMLTVAQYKRLSHSLQLGGTHPKAFTFTDFIRMKLLVFQPQLAKKFFRIAYIAFMVGILIPLTIGLVLDYYLISTLYLSMKSRAIVFYIIAWSTGAITTRLIYQLILLNPENRYAILINNANRLGLMQANLTILTKSIFLPVIAGGIFSLILPSISRLFENETGESRFTVGIEDVMVLPVLLLTYSSFKLLNSSFNSFWRWILRLREEEYIIGRRLENVTDEQAP